jgi:CRP-like cAMP-binding protein
MLEVRHRRIARELFVLGSGADALRLEPWVTDRLAALLEDEDTVAGQALFRYGDTPESFYFVSRGRVRTYRGPEGDRTPFDEVEGRCIVGLLDGLLDRARTRTAVATTNLEVMSVRLEGWLELLEESFDMARMTAAGLARRSLELRSRCRGPRPSLPARSGALDAADPMQLVERMAFLKSTPALQRAGVQVLSDLASCSTEVAFDAGHLLERRGQARDRLLVVVGGMAEATFAERRLSLRAGTGEIVGWPAIYVDQVEYDATARTSLRALAVPYEAWLDAMEEHFDMVRAGLAALTVDQEAWSEMLRQQGQERGDDDGSTATLHPG